MAFGHGNQKPARNRGRRRGRGARDGNVTVESAEPTAAERDAVISTILRNLAPHAPASAKPTRQGVINLIGAYGAARARSFDESVQSLRFQTRTPIGARQVLDFATQQGVTLNASDQSTRTGGNETGMARTKKQEEQRRAREEREAAAGKGGSKGQGGAQEAAGKGGAAKGGAQGAGAAKTPSAGAEARRARRTPRQPELPDPDGGFAQEKIGELDAAADAYITLRDEHAEITKRLSEAKAHLMDGMKRHKRDRYKFEGYVVVYTHEEAENVKVEKAKKSADDQPADV